MRTPATRRARATCSSIPGRSTKAGVRTPATLLDFREGGVPVRRSTKAGVRTPATRSHVRYRCRSPGSLNEGRGANPGDTPDLRAEGGVIEIPRSTKAGVRTPATPRQTGRGENMRERRSTKAGVRTPATLAVGEKWWPVTQCAQRRPGCEPRRHDKTPEIIVSGSIRSTKAGVRTPATPLIWPWTSKTGRLGIGTRQDGQEEDRSGPHVGFEKPFPDRIEACAFWDRACRRA